MNKSGLTQEDLDIAKDGEVKKGCLILTEEEYKEKAFEGRKDFKFVIAKNLKTVSSNLFSGSSLQFPFMPEVECIGDWAFKYSSLTVVCFLKVKRVGNYSFRGCKELIQVFLPVCEELGERCFGSCKMIKILDLPKAKKISRWQFSYCSSLTDLIIPLVEEIGENCFCECNSLESIDSKLDANQFRCGDYCDWYQKDQRCPICRGQLQNCLDKGNDQQNRLMIQKKLEEQKQLLVQDIRIAKHVFELKMEVDAQIREKDEQLKEKDGQIQQISTQLEDVKQELNKKLVEQNQQHQQEKEQHQQEIKRLMEQQQLNMEKIEIKVERMVKKFENQERENEELKKAVENFVRLLADK